MDEIKWVKFSGVTWLPDGSGFLYARYVVPAAGNFSGYDTDKLHYNAVYYHKLGTEQDQDALIYQHVKYPYHSISVHFTSGDRYLKLELDEGKKTITGFVDLHATGPDWFTRPLPEPIWLTSDKFDERMHCFHTAGS